MNPPPWNGIMIVWHLPWLFLGAVAKLASDDRRWVFTLWIPTCLSLNLQQCPVRTSHTHGWHFTYLLGSMQCILHLFCQILSVTLLRFSSDCGRGAAHTTPSLVLHPIKCPLPLPLFTTSPTVATTTHPQLLPPSLLSTTARHHHHCYQLATSDAAHRRRPC